MVPGNDVVPNGRFVLAFYGINDSPRATEGFFECVVQLMVRLGHAPDKLGVGRKGRAGKVGEYRRALAKLKRRGFADVVDFDIHSSLANAHVSATQYYASASLAHREDGSGYAVVAIPSGSDESRWAPFAKDAIERLRPGYGIAFERPLDKGPILYALGVNFASISDFRVATGDEYDQRRSISRWCDIGMRRKVYMEGLLRYVYRWNFLTEPQLRRKVDGLRLSAWIEADARRGRLSVFRDNVWLWEVQAEQLESIRDRLQDAGALFDWRQYCNVETHVKTRLA